MIIDQSRGDRVLANIHEGVIGSHQQSEKVTKYICRKLLVALYFRPIIGLFCLDISRQNYTIKKFSFSNFFLSNYAEICFVYFFVEYYGFPVTEIFLF